MNPTLVHARQQILDRHDAAMARWPNRQGDAFRREMQRVVGELQAIARAADDQHGDPLERSRTWRYLGDAYFDLAAGRERSALEAGASAYQRAEALVSDRDPLDRAKLDFNFGNTLRALGGATDRARMTEAKRRYERALNYFRRAAPQFVELVSGALRTLEAQLSLLDLHDHAAEQVKVLGEVQQSLAHAGTVDRPDVEKRARQVLSEVRGRGSAEAVARKAQSALEEFAAGFGQLTGTAGAPAPEQVQAQLGALQAQLARASAANADPQHGMMHLIFGALRERYQRDVARGVVSPARRQALDPLLAELEALLDHEPGEIAEHVAWLGKLRELMTRAVPLIVEPSTGKERPADASRAGRLLAFVGSAKGFLGGEVARAGLGSAERQAAADLLVRLSNVEMRLHAVPDEEARALERDVLRQVAIDIDAFALRHHLALAPAGGPPMFGTPSRPANPHAVFFSGREEIRSLVEHACRERGLNVVGAVQGKGDIAQARADALRTSNVAVFDLGEREGSRRAAVCYELGIARAFGRRVVILAPDDLRVPFDVESEPLRLTGGAEDEESVAEAIDIATYGIQRRQSDGSVRTTLAWARARFAEDERFEVRHTLGLLAEAGDDPIEARRALEAVLGFVGPDAPQVMLPAWPVEYPAAGTKRCFHVMPFSRPWSDDVRRIAEAACGPRARYVRGDAVPDPRVIRSIWDEICRASHVLVDLTDFNENVALELGIAHALGRNVLTVGQAGDIETLFPAVRRLRFHTYRLGDGGRSLTDLVTRFLDV